MSFALTRGLERKALEAMQKVPDRAPVGFDRRVRQESFVEEEVGEGW